MLAALPPLNIFRMLAHAESAFRPYLRFGGALLSEDLELDPVARELAILQVARLFEAEYEWIQHVAVGKAVGVTDEQIAALERGDLQADAFDDAQRALLRFATAAMTTTRASDEDFTAAREHYSPRVIVEVLLVCGDAVRHPVIEVILRVTASVVMNICSFALKPLKGVLKLVVGV